MRHHESSDELRETAALYALGALDREEARAFARHLAEGCSVCVREVRAFEGVVSELPGSVLAVEPAASVRVRVLAAVQALPDRAGATAKLSSLAAAQIVRAAEGDWVELSAGVYTKTLHTDPRTGRITALVRMEPKARVETHRHVSVEEVFILEGDCHIARDHVLYPGDYYRAEAGTVHDYTYTETGTTFLSVYLNEFTPATA